MRPAYARDAASGRKGGEKRHEYAAQDTQAGVNALGRVHVGAIRIFFQGLGEFWDPVPGRGVRRLCKGALPISSKASPRLLCCALMGFP